MNNDSVPSNPSPQATAPWRQRFMHRPSTHPGWWAVGGLVTGWFAVLRRGERSCQIWLSIFPGMLLIILLLGEILVPH